MSWQRICSTSDVETNGMRQFTAQNGSDVLVLNGNGAYFACQAMCPHLDTPLEEGMFDGTTLTCHQHLWQWAIAGGEPEGLAELPLECFPTKIEDGAVFVDLV